MLALRLLADAPDPAPALVPEQRDGWRPARPARPVAAAPAAGPQWVGDTLF
jgi:hypothetical protein